MSVNFFYRILTSLLLLIATMLAPSAKAASSNWVINDQTQVRLISGMLPAENSATTQAPWLGVHFRLAPGWRIYWRTPGDAGMPPSFDWKGSGNSDLAALTVQWPAPKRYSDPSGLQDFVYQDEVVFPLALPVKDATKDSTMILALNYVACKDICVPFTATMTLTVPPGNRDPEAEALLTTFKKQVPKQGNGLTIIAYRLNTDSQGKILLEVKAKMAAPLTNPDLLVEGAGDFRFLKPSIILADDRLSALFSIPVIASSPDQKLDNKPLHLTLVSDKASPAEVDLLPGTLPPAPLAQTAPATESITQYSLLIILGFAFLGGLILNVMPCVLPVLSIKLFGILKHGGASRSHIRLSFFASAAGIVTSFIVIGLCLILLQSLGKSVGFGFQFQEPFFVITLIIILVLFACNLLGSFEIRLPSRLTGIAAHASSGNTIASHFLTGAFATLLATPCTAPFLGTAISFALLHSPLYIIGIFALMGIGMATPYLLLALFPAAIALLPKPGNWMVTARYLLGIVLFATVIWLIYVLAGQLGMKAALLLLLLCVLLKYFLERHQGIFSFAAIKISIILLTIALAFLIPMATMRNDTIKTAQIQQLWQPFAPGNIASLVQKGQIVVVDVTADWCLTCKINKLTTLDRADVITLLSAKNITPMLADITLPDPAVNDYLKSFERYGIPFNAVYGPKAPHGIPLSVLITKSDLVHAMKQAGWRAP
jgi:suppressor for copper-sensitivity B